MKIFLEPFLGEAIKLGIGPIPGLGLSIYSFLAFAILGL